MYHLQPLKQMVSWIALVKERTFGIFDGSGQQSVRSLEIEPCDQMIRNLKWDKQNDS